MERYSKKFWESYTEIEGYEKYISQIESSEKKHNKLVNQERLLEQKLENLRDPLEDLIIQYPPNNSKRVYSKTEDRFLLVCVRKYGLFDKNLFSKVKMDIMESDLFKFDWYFLSRSPQEIGRRINTLLLAITREMDGPISKKKKLTDSSAGSRLSSIEPTSNGNAKNT